MLQSGASLLRLPLTDTKDRFSLLAEWRTAGMTKYVAIITRFAAESIIGEMDAVYSSWGTRAAEGFSDNQLAALERIVPYDGAYDPNANGKLSRTRRRPARAERANRARHRRAHRCRHLIQRPERFHAHHRHRAGPSNPIAKRLLRRDRLRDP